MIELCHIIDQATEAGVRVSAFKLTDEKARFIARELEFVLDKPAGVIYDRMVEGVCWLMGAKVKVIN